MNFVSQTCAGDASRLRERSYFDGASSGGARPQHEPGSAGRRRGVDPDLAATSSHQAGVAQRAMPLRFGQAL